MRMGALNMCQYPFLYITVVFWSFVLPAIAVVLKGVHVVPSIPICCCYQHGLSKSQTLSFSYFP